MPRDGSASARAAPASLPLIQAHVRDAVSFQSLDSGLTWWHDVDPHGTPAAAAYVDTGRSWIAVGTPLCDRAHAAAAVKRASLALRLVATIGPVVGTTALAPAWLTRGVRRA